MRKETYLPNLPTASFFPKMLSDFISYPNTTFFPLLKQHALNFAMLRKFKAIFNLFLIKFIANF